MKPRFIKDIFAGITVGIIATPLAMALAIASGVAPQYGLYTAIIAGFVIALTGGSRFSVSSPTAAFVVILYPIAQKYGVGGLLLASIMAGGLLITIAHMRLGRFIEYIPEPATLGFTGGIAVVIATSRFEVSVDSIRPCNWHFRMAYPMSSLTLHFFKIISVRQRAGISA